MGKKKATRPKKAKAKASKGRRPGATELAVCERRHDEWLDYSGGMTKKQLIKKYGIARRTLDRDLHVWEEEMMEKLRANATDDAAAKAITNYYRVFNTAIDMLAMAEEEEDPKAKFQGMRSALSEMRGAQRDMDSLLVKAGFYRGPQQAQVEINQYIQMLDRFTKPDWERFAPQLTGYLERYPEDFRALMRWGRQMGLDEEPIEGTVKVLGDGEDD